MTQREIIDAIAALAAVVKANQPYNYAIDETAQNVVIESNKKAKELIILLNT